MGNLFGGLGRPGNDRGATGESIPVVRDTTTECKRKAGRYMPSVKFVGLPVPKTWLIFGHGVNRPGDLDL